MKWIDHTSQALCCATIPFDHSWEPWGAFVAAGGNNNYPMPLCALFYALQQSALVSDGEKQLACMCVLSLTGQAHQH